MQAELRKAVYKHVESLTNLPVFFPNRAVSNKLDTDTPSEYLAVKMLPVDAYTTLVQIDVFSELGIGDINNLVIIDSVQTGFKIGTRLIEASYQFTATKPPELSPAFTYNSRWVQSITANMRHEKKC